MADAGHFTTPQGQTELLLTKLNLIFKAFCRKLEERQRGKTLLLHSPPVAQRSLLRLPRWNGKTPRRRRRPRKHPAPRVRSDHRAPPQSLSPTGEHPQPHQAVHGPSSNADRGFRKSPGAYLKATWREGGGLRQLVAVGHETRGSSDHLVYPILSLERDGLQWPKCGIGRIIDLT
ncbi:Hypothetical predicted protein [Pelobates cultripes]|uniref:Uncharacterized protein n=1 Tax=Pelobates cultripes TaxID=61616 RepID=A0AAD1WAA7_PELCU|nr:Hypothetical predicted protein [Pelobates cultripes]